jgi:hypothetical protein
LVIVRVENENDTVNPSIASVPLRRVLLIQVGADPVTAEREAEAIVAWPLSAVACLAGRMQQKRNPSPRAWLSLRPVGLVPTLMNCVR